MVIGPVLKAAMIKPEVALLDSKWPIYTCMHTQTRIDTPFKFEINGCALKKEILYEISFKKMKSYMFPNPHTLILLYTKIHIS